MKALWSPLALLAVSAGLFLLGSARAQEKGATPPYPRTNSTICYQVDPSWPQRPAGIKWGHVPGIAVDGKDRVWVYTRAEPPVQVYDASGKFLKSWGSDVIKTAHHIKFDSRGNVWVADIGYHVVMQFTPEGKLLKTLGTRGKPGCDETHLDQPTDMAVTPEGEVYVSDGYGNNRIVHFDKNGRFVKAWGKLGTRPGDFSLPHAIVLVRDRLYVADRNNVRVQVFDRDGKLLDVWNNLMVPWGFWVTPKQEIWICGSSPMSWRKEDVVLGCPPDDQVFMKFTPEGRLVQLWSVPKSPRDGEEKPGECNWVHAIAEDSKGNLYVGDIIGQRAQKFVRIPAGRVVPAVPKPQARR